MSASQEQIFSYYVVIRLFFVSTYASRISTNFDHCNIPKVVGASVDKARTANLEIHHTTSAAADETLESKLIS